MPDSDEIHVPLYYTKKDLHTMFCVEAGALNNISGLPGYSAFTVFWKNHFPFVKFPDKHYLGKCDTCTELKALKMKQLSSSQTERVKKLLIEHNEAQQAERKAYATRSALVSNYPEINHFRVDLILRIIYV